MLYRTFVLLCFFGLTSAVQAQVKPDNTQLAVWANEAIVATYTYDYQNFLPRQKEIASYFTADGWIRYSKALQDSKLPESIQTNSYSVSAAATMPPEIKAINDHQWQATMPVLVIYSNPTYKQKQSLTVTMTFTQVPAGTGVRGLAITNLQTVETAPPCQCARGEKYKAVG